MLKKVGDISAYHESCFKNENSEKFGKSLVLDCSGGSVGIMQFKVKKMNNIAHEDLQVKYFMPIFFLYEIFLSFSVEVIFEVSVESRQAIAGFQQEE